MKKQLIAVGLAGLLTIPAVSFGAELYGSFRTGLTFGSGDASVADFTSRWGFRGSYEVSEGLTASYRYESKFNTTNAESSGSTAGGPGGRLSFVSLSGGFGAITAGQIWSASANYYGFAVDPSYVNGLFGGANYRNASTISYSSSAGDVSFQIDKVTGDAAKIEIGASAALGPVGVGLGYWSNADDDASFTGVAVSAGAAGVNLTIGLGSSDDATGVGSDTSILHIGGSVGDSGLSYAVQIVNGETDADDLNLIVVTNSLGSGASLIFEHASPGEADASSLLGLKVDF